MTKKNCSILFFLGIFICFVLVLSFFIFDKIIPYKIFFLFLFFGTCLMLPSSFQCIRIEENPTPTSWRILVSNIMSVIFCFISFLICLRLNV